ncbi:efflux RND transporter periplasmic adaptor subunit [Hydrogenimonas sp.]
MRNSLKILLAVTVAAVGGWLFYQKIYIPKATYDYVTPTKGSLTLTVFGIGQVGAKNLYPVGSHFGGKLLEVTKEEGEWVKKGEIVARFDPVDMPQELASLEAALQKAREETVAQKRSVESLLARQELARINFARYERLYKQGYAAKAEYDNAKADLRSLQAQIAAARAQVKAAMSEEKRLKKSIEGLKIRIEKLTVTAPVSGLVVKKEAAKGQTLAPQAPIVTLVKPEEVWVRLNIDERISGGVKTGQKARITLRSRESDPMTGSVVRIEPQSDPVTEERIVDIAFDRLPEPFYLNEQAEATIETGRLDGVWLLPARVVTRGGVWVYEGGEAHFRKLEILGRHDKSVAVKGVKAGEKILVPDPHKKPLFNGVDVRL